MKKTTYADQCLERAEKMPVPYAKVVDELARRLKRACKLLRTASIIFAEADGGWAYKINEIADELEALPEDEK